VKAALAVAALLAAAGCHTDPTDGSVDGAKIFEATCSTCHGPRGKPDAATMARIAPRDLTAPEFRARVTADLVEHQVINGSDNRRMPPLGTALKPEQIKAVAAYVASPAFLQQQP
jgi:mono/diheme cytochrome c family protein